MTDDPNAMSHHATRLLDNPAWRRLIDDLRRQLDSEQHGLPLSAPERLEISIAQTMLRRMEKRAEALKGSGKVEQLNAANAKRAAQG